MADGHGHLLDKWGVVDVIGYEVARRPDQLDVPLPLPLPLPGPVAALCPIQYRQKGVVDGDGLVAGPVAGVFRAINRQILALAQP